MVPSTSHPPPLNRPSQLLTKEPDRDEEDDYLTMTFTVPASTTSISTGKEFILTT
jgi:hypothetical protein